MKKTPYTQLVSIQSEDPPTYQSVSSADVAETKNNDTPSSKDLDRGRPKADVLYRLWGTAQVTAAATVCTASYTGAEKDPTLATGVTAATVFTVKSTMDITQFAHEQAKYINQLNETRNDLHQEIHSLKLKLSQDSTLPAEYSTNFRVGRNCAFVSTGVGFIAGAFAGKAASSEKSEYLVLGALLGYAGANLIASIVYSVVIKKQRSQINRLENMVWELAREVHELRRQVAGQEARAETSMTALPVVAQPRG